MVPPYPPPQISEHSTDVVYPNVEENSPQFPRRDYLENDRHTVPREEECRQEIIVELGGKVYSVIGGPPRKTIAPPQETPVESEPVKDITFSLRENRKRTLPEDPSSKPEFVPGPRLSRTGKRIGRPPKLRSVLVNVPEENQVDEKRICRWKACGKQFTEQDEFIDHVEAHIKEDGKIRKCLWEGCSHTKLFHENHLFLAHARRHTGFRPHACEEPGCHKAFFLKENLFNHRCVHIGEQQKRIKDFTQFPQRDYLENAIPREEECREEITVELGGKVYSVIDGPVRKKLASQQEKPEESEPVKDVTKSPRENRKRPLPEDPSSKPESAPKPRLSRTVAEVDQSPEKSKASLIELVSAVKNEKRICMWKACGKPFTEQDEFINHVEAHIKEDGKIRKCLWKGCSHTKPFPENCFFLAHVRRHTGYRPYACKEPGCHKTYFLRQTLNTHRCVRTGMEPFQCQIYQKTVASSHKKRDHGRKIKSPTQQPEDPKRVKDATQFPRNDHFENDRHTIPREEECRQAITVELGGKVYSVVCGPPRKTIAPPQEKSEESEPVKDVICSPIENRRRALPEDPSSKSEFVPMRMLSKTGKRVGRSLGDSKLKQSVTMPDDVAKEKDDDVERICRWKDCEDRFTQEKVFVCHVEAHMKEDGEHKCWKCHWEGCTRTPFDAYYKLQAHVRSHTKEKPFVCTVLGCNAAFSRVPSLKMHTWLHTGEKPYECSICGKRFANRYNKALHEKQVHSDRKQYQCGVETCGKSYKDPSALRNHFCLHHPELFEEFKAGKHRVYIRRDEEEQ